MPNTKSAKKRMRSSEGRRELNVAVSTRVKSLRRSFRETLDAGNKAEAEKSFKAYCSILDKASKQGVLKRNTAARRKTRAAAAVRAMA